MLRKARQEDMAQMVRLRSEFCRESPAQAEAWLKDVAGLENLLVLEHTAAGGGAPRLEALLVTVAVECGRRRGIWLCGTAMADTLRQRGMLPRLLEALLRAYGTNSYHFVVTVPASKQDRTELESVGFENAFPVRLLQKPIERNLWAQADFDTMTVRRLQQARLHYQPSGIQLPDACMAGIVQRLYSQGITLVSNQRGYGLFYQRGDTLQFIELQADNDHCADLLLQAARNQTGAEKAQLLLAEPQTLYLGTGKRFSYGMIRFLRQPFSISDVYFRALI